jgi:hypothetical protein
MLFVEENGRDLAESFLAAARIGDWRAAEALMNRIYGKPEETVRQVEVNPATSVLKSMSLKEAGAAAPFAGRRTACAVSARGSYERERRPPAIDLST